MKNIVAGTFIAVLLGAAPGIMPLPAMADEGQPVQAEAQEVKVVQVAEYLDEAGNTVTVTTYSDGSVSVSINGNNPVRGARAMEVLAAHGINLSVSPSGEILGQTLKSGASVKAAPHAPAAPSANAAMPANIAAGSGMGISASMAESGNNTFTQNNINGISVSR